MSAASILVTGAGGMLGGTLVKAWESCYQVVGATQSRSLRAPRSWTGDLSERQAADEVIRYATPDLVVHAAAFTDVNACEAEPGKAMKVNAEATGRLAGAAARAGCGFVYISTEGVFDGARGGYREADAPRPVNQYAASKLAGEKEAAAAHPGALILRIGLEGWRPRGSPGFVQWVVEGLRKGEPRKICTDWVHTVVFAQNLAEIIVRLWQLKASGIFHVGAREASSNWAIAQAASDEFELDASMLEPITSDQLHLSAARPKNVSLVCDRLREAIGDCVWDLRRGLNQMRIQEDSGELAAIRALVRA